LAESDISFQTRYKSFMRMIREFRHMKLMKRSGRGNIKNGLISTSPSDLTVLCPACPIPGINLQDEWEQVPKEMRYDFPPSWSYLTILQVSLYFNPSLRCKLSIKEPDAVIDQEGPRLTYQIGLFHR
jgi:hypothetical protein